MTSAKILYSKLAESERIIEGSLNSYNRLQIILGLREPEEDYSTLIPDGDNQEKSTKFNFVKNQKRPILSGRRNPKSDLIN